MSDGSRNLTFAKGLGVAVCAVGLLAGAFVLTRSKLSGRPPPPAAQVAGPEVAGPEVAGRDVAAPKPSPSLHCLFSDFTHGSVVVGFDFAVALTKGGAPRFAERAEAVRDDPAVNFDADNRPAWLYAVDEDGTPTIASPDGATRILLYGFKPRTPNGTWIDVGLRSNTFRNLDGKCLQAHFDDAGRQGVTRTAPP